MPLIIDISEEDYQKINSGEKIIELSCNIVDAIANGTPLEQIRDEIERLHYHPKLDFIKNDEVVEMALNIIEKYK